MKWASALSGKDFLGSQSYGSVRELIHECSEKIQFQLENQKPDLLIAFISPHFQNEYEKIPELLLKECAPKHLIGCSAGGLIGGGMEVEQEKAVALTAAIMPDVEIKTFHLLDEELPDLDAGPSEWERLMGVSGAQEPNFILLPDQFSFNIDPLVQGLDFAFPKATKLGGMASGANQPGMNVLIEGDRVYHKGIVGASFSGNVVVDPLVAQGCRPIGKPMRVTKCTKNFLIELDGEPAVQQLHALLEGLDKNDQALARNALFLGVVMNEFKDEIKAGDFLIRNILGIEPRTGALVVGDLMNNERTVQFHLRDAETSSDDLKQLLRNYKQAGQDERNAAQASGALLFSCLGRGRQLYGTPNHDSDCFREYLGEVPLGGFFCNGEIGPVGGTTFLHGYTSSFGIFREKVAAPK